VKNPAQKQFAFMIAAAVALFVLVAAGFFLWMKQGSIAATQLIILTVGSLLFTYAVTYLILEEYVFKKIRTIYSVINQLKISKDYPVNEQQSANIIDDVEKQVIDFSMRKSAEIEELKKLEQYRRDFLGNVSHELKTPIFNTQGYIETLLDGGLDDPKINKDYLEKATKNLDRLASIVEDLLQISQYESGKLVLDIERFDIHQLTQDVFDALSYQAKSKQISLSFKSESNLPFFVEADKVRISQVLNNLISNAIKYGREKGNVFVGFSVVDNLLLTEISDDGMGIAQEHLSRLFERFYRVDKARSREKGGTGLGLSIVKHILEAHGQTVNVRSTVGIGTTFSFALKLG
jgi:two-component system phosphate regulon sensor histidine kinase PhoR